MLKQQSIRNYTTFVLLLCSVFTSAVFAQADEELARKLSNPVASLIIVPFQFNFMSCIGAGQSNVSGSKTIERKAKKNIKLYETPADRFNASVVLTS